MRDSERTLYSIDDSLDSIFNFIENVLRINKDYHFVDSVFESLDFSKWCESELIGFLTITLPFKKFLRKRERYFKLVKVELLKYHDKKEVENILHGLE